jgi:hypothetical protein
MFWNPDTQLEMSILAEPDVRSMTEFLKGANFVGPRYTKKRSEIYVHQLPEKYCPEETLAYINAITAKIRQFR